MLLVVFAVQVGQNVRTDMEPCVHELFARKTAQKRKVSAVRFYTAKSRSKDFQKDTTKRFTQSTQMKEISFNIYKESERIFVNKQAYAYCELRSSLKPVNETTGTRRIQCETCLRQRGRIQGAGAIFAPWCFFPPFKFLCAGSLPPPPRPPTNPESVPGQF